MFKVYAARAFAGVVTDALEVLLESVCDQGRAGRSQVELAELRIKLGQGPCVAWVKAYRQPTCLADEIAWIVANGVLTVRLDDKIPADKGTYNKESDNGDVSEGRYSTDPSLSEHYQQGCERQPQDNLADHRRRNIFVKN